MRLTKDEARILAQSLNEYKYNVVNEFKDFKELGLFPKLLHLQIKLEMFGDDKRRNGRSSLDSLYDCFKRFVNQNKL